MESMDFVSTIGELQLENKNLRQEVEALRRLASFPLSDPSLVFEFNNQGQAIFINPAAQEILAHLGLKVAEEFLPHDLLKDTGWMAADREAPPVVREVKIAGHTFKETIFFSSEYNTLRVYGTDITRQKIVEDVSLQSQQELKQALDLLETVTKENNIIIAALDNQFCYTYFNQAYQEELQRLTGKEIQIGMSLSEAFEYLPEQGKVALEEWGQVLRGKTTVKSLEFGDPGIYRRVYNIMLSPIRDASGDIIGAGEVARDITQDILAQEALFESESRFRMLLKNIPIIIAAQDMNLRYLWIYPEQTGVLSDITTKTDKEFFSPDLAAWLTALKQQVLETGKDIREQAWITIGDRRAFTDLYLEPLRDMQGNIIGVGSVAIDLTSTKLVEESLAVSEARYYSLFQGITEGFAIHEMIYDESGKPYDYRFLDVNPAFERLTGFTHAQVVGKTYRELLPDEGDSRVNIYAKVISTGEPIKIVDYSPTFNKYYEIFAYRTAPDQFAVIFLDITARKRMEDDLLINLTKYSVLFDTIPVGITVSDQNGQVIESNQEAERLLGLSKEEHKHRSIHGKEWKVVRPDKTPMPVNEYAGVRALQEQRRIDNVEMGIVKENDEITWIKVTASPLPVENHGVVITYHDVTERIQAQEALRKTHESLEITVQQRTEELHRANLELLEEVNERKRIASELLLQTKALEAQRQRFNDVLELLPAFLVLLTPDYHVTFANRYFRQHFGEDYGQRCYEYLCGLNSPCENCETYKVLQPGVEQHVWEWAGSDGYNYIVHDFPFTDVDGSTLILEMGIDITERKQAEDKLRLSDAYNRSLLEANPDTMVTITPDGKIGDVNAATEVITGYTREELIGTDFHSYFTNPDKARAGYQQVFETGTVRDYELEIQHRDGRVIPVLYHASVFRDEKGEVAGVFASARDITERKAVEKQLVLLNTALESAANGILVTDKSGRILWANPAFTRITGYSIEETLGQNPRIVKSGEQDQTFYKNLWDTILAGNVWHGEIINRRKNGNLYYEDQTITPVVDEEGNVTNFIAIMQDITDHKQAEEALILSEEKYRSLVIATSQIVWQTNAQGAMVEDNSTWRAITGQTLEESLGQGWIDALHPDDRQRTAEIWAHAVETETLYNTEYRIKNSNSEFGYYIATGAPVRDKHGVVTGWIGTCTDITENKHFEIQLIQAEKHAAIGRMVGSVTHEINNPLQTIKNCLYLIQQEIDNTSSIQDPLDMAFSETRRLTHIVDQLRQLHRPQTTLSMYPHNLLDIIEEVRSLISHHLYHTKVSWQPLTGLQNCTITCFRDQMIEVFLNISMNAIEAMQSTGGTNGRYGFPAG